MRRIPVAFPTVLTGRRGTDVQNRKPIALLVPTRARPHNARKLIDAWWSATEGKSTLYFMVDSDDPEILSYQDIAITVDNADVVVMIGRPARLVEWTNFMAEHLWQRTGHKIFGSIGDDHLPESSGWESAIIEAVEAMPNKAGVVYGDDGVHGGNLATAFFMTANITDALGYMCPPELEHLYCDNAAMDIGRASTLIYLPDVKITHYHPIAGKAEWDDTYVRGNEGRVQHHDSLAYSKWKAEELPQLPGWLSTIVV